MEKNLVTIEENKTVEPEYGNYHANVLKSNGLALAKKNIMRVGECKHCGKCCEHKSYFKTENDVIVFVEINTKTCEAFDPKTRMCKEYDKRPDICRAYPYSPQSIFRDGCGYSFEEIK